MIWNEKQAVPRQGEKAARRRTMQDLHSAPGGRVIQLRCALPIQFLHFINRKASELCDLLMA